MSSKPRILSGAATAVPTRAILKHRQSKSIARLWRLTHIQPVNFRDAEAPRRTTGRESRPGGPRRGGIHIIAAGGKQCIPDTMAVATRRRGNLQQIFAHACSAFSG